MEKKKKKKEIIVVECAREKICGGKKETFASANVFLLDISAAPLPAKAHISRNRRLRKKHDTRETTKATKRRDEYGARPRARSKL